jgi:F0F1-type ATP synthase assembly protein I
MRRVSRVVPRRVPETAGERELNRGVEMAAVVGVLVAIGIVADRALGTTPWCTVGAALWASIAQFVKIRYAYSASLAAAAARRATSATAHQRGRA